MALLFACISRRFPIVIIHPPFSCGNPSAKAARCALARWRTSHPGPLNGSTHCAVPSRASSMASTATSPPTCGPIFAVLFVLKQLADRIGLTRVLGKERRAKLALLLVLVRVAAQGSRLSAVRWAANHAVAETLGLGGFDADDLSAALDALAPRQAQIEETLYHMIRRQTGLSPNVVLYDVTSSDRKST